VKKCHSYDAYYQKLWKNSPVAEAINQPPLEAYGQHNHDNTIMRQAHSNRRRIKHQLIKYSSEY